MRQLRRETTTLLLHRPLLPKSFFTCSDDAFNLFKTFARRVRLGSTTIFVCLFNLHTKFRRHWLGPIKRSVGKNQSILAVDTNGLMRPVELSSFLSGAGSQQYFHRPLPVTIISLTIQKFHSLLGCAKILNAASSRSLEEVYTRRYDHLFKKVASIQSEAGGGI